MASKRQTIINALLTALEGITVLGGYHNDVKFVYRGLRNLEGITPDKLPCICKGSMQEVRHNMNKTQFKSDIKVLLVGYVCKTSEDQDLQELLDDLIEDVTKAIEADLTFGNLALWSEIQTIETDRGDLDNSAAFGMEVLIQYASSGTTP